MPGQFIILRVNETGERIPLTIADYDREAGTVTIIYQKVGKSTLLLDEQEAGGYLMDFIGRWERPLSWKATRRPPSSAAAPAAPSLIPRPRLCMPWEPRWI